jgi:hypothetical protein
LRRRPASTLGVRGADARTATYKRFIVEVATGSGCATYKQLWRSRSPRRLT